MSCVCFKSSYHDNVVRYWLSMFLPLFLGVCAILFLFVTLFEGVVCCAALYFLTVTPGFIFQILHNVPNNEGYMQGIYEAHTQKLTVSNYCNVVYFLSDIYRNMIIKYISDKCDKVTKMECNKHVAADVCKNNHVTVTNIRFSERLH